MWVSSRGVLAGVHVVGSTLLLACGPGPARSEAVALRVEAVVYGGDDRLEYFDHPDPRVRELAAHSSVALVDGKLVERMYGGSLRQPEDSFGELYDLCAGERFAEQPSLAHCSGTLVGPDLVLTSAHCLDVVPCQELALVFGYLYRAEGELAEVTGDDVYGCREVVAASDTDAAGRDVDHAWLRLDRPVAAPRRPAELHRGDDALLPGQPLTVIGFSAGLPLKIDSGAQVLDARPTMLDFFRANSDTFHGNSGSGVFDAAGRLRGVLARGADDYIQDMGGCNLVRTDSNDEIDQREEATYLARAVEGLCSHGERDLEVCRPTVPMLPASRRTPTCSGLPQRPATTSPAGLLSVLLLLLVLHRRRRAPR